MIPDEIRDRFNAITVIRKSFAFILEIAPLLALYAIGRALRGEPRTLPLVTYDEK